MKFAELSPELETEGRRIMATPGSVGLWHRWLDKHNVEGVQAWTDSAGKFWLKDQQGNVHMPLLNGAE